MAGPSKTFVPGTYLVDHIPLLRYVPKWFPGANFQRIAEEYRELTRKTREVPFEMAEREIVRVKIQPFDDSVANLTGINFQEHGRDSVVKQFLREIDVLDSNDENLVREEKRVAQNVAGMAYTGQ